MPGPVLWLVGRLGAAGALATPPGEVALGVRDGREVSADLSALGYLAPAIDRVRHRPSTARAVRRWSAQAGSSELNWMPASRHPSGSSIHT
jgi:hypothetical protein